MITDQLISVATGILATLFSLLPGPGDHSWLDSAGPTIVAPAYAFDSVLPLHELLTVLGIMITLAIPAFGLRLALFVYRHLPIIGKG